MRKLQAAERGLKIDHASAIINISEISEKIKQRQKLILCGILVL